MVQLFPDLTLTLTQSGNDLTVLLEGLGQQGPRPNRVDIILEQAQSRTNMDAEAINLTAFKAPNEDIPAWVSVADQTLQVDSSGRGMSVITIDQDLIVRPFSPRMSPS